tara:strand:+ start:157 stop:333 length:177 start_codon:yes stop_codon:yes gene_type:complete
MAIMTEDIPESRKMAKNRLQKNRITILNSRGRKISGKKIQKEINRIFTGQTRAKGSKQ